MKLSGLSPDYRKKSKGFILVTTYLVTTVIASFSLAFFLRAQAFQQATERNQNKIIAFNMAEAGVDLALARLATDPGYTGTNGYVSMATDSIRGGFSVTVTTPPGSPIMRIIQSSGFAPGNDNTDRAYQATGITAYGYAQPKGGFNFGVFADGNISLTGNAIVDSYHSKDGSYGHQNHSTHGDIGTNSTDPESITLHGNALVNGNAVVGPEGDPAVTIKLNGNAAITGDRSAALAPTVYEPATASIPSSGELSISGNNTEYLLPGTYRYDSISITGNGKLHITGPVKIYVDGALDIAGNGIANQSDLPPNCLIYVTRASTVKLSGNGHLYAGIYAPLADVQNSGNGSIFGAVVSKSYTQTGNGAIHFDEALKDVAVGGRSKMVVTAWQEQNALAWGTGS